MRYFLHHNPPVTFAWKQVGLEMWQRKRGGCVQCEEQGSKEGKLEQKVKCHSSIQVQHSLTPPTNEAIKRLPVVPAGGGTQIC